MQIAGSRMVDQLREVVAEHRLTPGQMDLNDAQFRGLGKSAAPLCCRELIASVREVDWIAAIDASQRTSIGEFGDEGVGARRGAHCTSPRARIDSRNLSASILSVSRST